ncbi:MAG: HAMP domain-containing sensor histidine kinase [Candidatus Binatia bacterium]
MRAREDVPASPEALMLHEFLSENREDIIARTRAHVAKRPAPRATNAELDHGIPLFLTQLVDMLRTPRLEAGEAKIVEGATKHGDDLLRMGFTVGQVVQDYGGLCQAITELAVERKAAIGGGEFKILNGCLDNAVAAAVTEFGRQRETSISEQGVEHLGLLAHELRNALNTATLGFSALQSGAVGTSGSTSGVVFRSLARMRDLLDRSLAEVRLKAGIHRRTNVVVAVLIEDVAIAAAVEATHRGLQLTVGPVAESLRIHADAQILVSALSNLLQNAFKFTRPGGHVSLNTHSTVDRVRIDIEDECGGLPAGRVEDLFRMFEQRGTDRTGLGLGLAISRQGVEESGGTIRVRDLPGQGCVFTVDLPRQP